MDLQTYKWQKIEKRMKIQAADHIVAFNTIKANEQYVFLLGMSNSTIAWQIFDFRDNNNNNNVRKVALSYDFDPLKFDFDIGDIVVTGN